MVDLHFLDLILDFHLLFFLEVLVVQLVLDDVLHAKHEHLHLSVHLQELTLNIFDRSFEPISLHFFFVLAFNHTLVVLVPLDEKLGFLQANLALLLDFLMQVLVHLTQVEALLSQCLSLLDHVFLRASD